jgi:nicotinamidase-related amidase
MSSDGAEDALADLLGLTLATRPERVTDGMFAGMTPEQRAAYAATTQTVGTLARAEAPVTPSAGLRGRILASVAGRLARQPRRALLVCDMINDHLTPGRPLEVPRARAIVPALAKRLDEARAAGVAVVYVLDRHEPGDPELDEWGQHAVEGSEGAEVWPPLAPKAGDRVVTKPAYSAFFQTDLEQVLDELHIDTVVLTGCATEVQLMSTATDALQKGFAIEIPPDAQAGSSEVTEYVTLSVLAALAPYAPARKARLERLQLAVAT